MKKIAAFFLILSIFNIGCAEKKRKAILFPFFAMMVDEGGSQTKTESTSSSTEQSNTGSSVQVPPASTTINNSNSEVYQVLPEQNDQYSVVPTNSNTSTAATTTSNTASTTDNTATSNTTSTAPPTPSLSEQNLTASVQVASTKEPFKFETTRAYNVDMLVVDANQTSIPNALVAIYEVNPQTGETILIFQQVTNSEGKVKGQILVNQALESVEATVTLGNQTSRPVPIPLVVAVAQPNGTTVNMPVATITKIVVPIAVPTPPAIADADGDGVPDVNDFYPNDPTKSTKLRFPSQSVYTVAYEDLFPSAGDADLNDYVIQMFNEEDLNAEGKIVEIRGVYQHVARGAGYKHTLNLRLPKQTSFTFESVVYDANGVDMKTGKVRYTPSQEEIQDGIEILGDSSKTISSQNVDPSKPFKPGHKAVVKIVFDRPVSRAELGTAPYDLFIRILSKRIDDNRYPEAAPRAINASLQFYEVHFPNLYFDSKGKDVYIDSKGFPWAILVPKSWAWPLEGSTYDIRGSKSAYPKFKIWMDSKGELEKDWYMYPDTRYSYPVPDLSSSLTAYISNLGSASWGLALAFILVAFFVLFVRKRMMKTSTN